MFRLLRSVNRWALGLIGLVLLCAGGVVIAVGAGWAVPSWWPYSGPHDTLLSHADRFRWRGEGWFWPTVIAALAILLVLSLWWLLAQARRSRVPEVLVDSGDGEGARVRARALEDVLEREAEAHDGVARAQAVLTGRRSRSPAARMRVLLEPHAAPEATLGRVTDEALAHARESAGLASLPAEIRLRAARHSAERVR
ncbi:alkaline shock response membrane anchor protein AmaP [Streptomyces fuscigenes]|uniref:alkaline shock response membrane anchor protein AmaP n=1 Tax=Streptomyces fuscigenes TaxID=1528880 RepID=UPI001F234A87|nr:alkaline shock response membrane anchor protein AmaP [Streptomyces fuscigenes]MCF3961359.1 alkaline shock response membrane anchor protein AmaP [Streptomyces fuscigenes]